MELRDSIFGSIAVPSEDGSVKSVNIASLVRSLILFDHIYLETSLLREIPFFINAFGYKGLLRLLEEPDLEIISDALTAGSVGQSIIAENRPMGVLPLGSYDINPVRLHEPGKQFEAALKNVEELTIDPKKKRKLIRKLEKKLIRYPTGGETAFVDYRRQLKEEPESILPAIRHTAATIIDAKDTQNIQIKVEELNFGRGFRIQSNLSELYKVDEEKAHRVIERALLGIAGLGQRLEIMQKLNAITGFQPDEVVMLRSKLDFVMKSVDPKAQEERLDRVVSLGGLPLLDSLAGSNVIDVEALLKIRKQPGCIKMRQWLRTLDTSTDADISTMFKSVHEKLARATHSKGVIILRFLATNGLSIGPHGIIAGPASAATDQFIVDKLIGTPGPVTFLSKEYRSIFR